MGYLKLHRSSQTNSSAGLRAVAALEATKGVLVLLLGFGVLSLIHKNLDDVAQRLTEILRINPEGRLSSVFLNLANHTTDKTLWVVATGALVYATVRSIEAFGLWRGREWAQWFALLSGALYLPGEMYSLARTQVGSVSYERRRGHVHGRFASKCNSPPATMKLVFGCTPRGKPFSLETPQPVNWQAESAHTPRRS